MDYQINYKRTDFGEMDMSDSTRQLTQKFIAKDDKAAIEELSRFKIQKAKEPYCCSNFVLKRIDQKEQTTVIE